MTNSDGSFRFEGLKAGSYRFYIQDDSKTDTGASEELGEFEIIKGKTINIINKISRCSAARQGRRFAR